MNDIKTLTNQLKQALADMDEVKEYIAARDAYMSNGELITLVNEYNVQCKVLDTEGTKPDADEMLVSSIKARIETLYTQITENPVAKAFAEKEAAIAEIYNGIYDELQSVVVPKHNHDSCGGNCSSCHGCH